MKIHKNPCSNWPGSSFVNWPGLLLGVLPPIILLVCLCTIFGCDGPKPPSVPVPELVPPIIKPPKYNKGDVVTVTPKVTKCQLGVITAVRQCTDDNFKSTHWWEYTVMFQDIDLTFKENGIELYKHAIWVAPDGEITLEGFP